MPTNTDVTTAVVLGWIRSALMVLGGVLVSRKIIDQEFLQESVGVIVMVLTVVWTTWNKFHVAARIENAGVIGVQAGVDAERVKDDRVAGVPSGDIDPLHAKALIQEATPQ